jgi:hypothetical protein
VGNIYAPVSGLPQGGVSGIPMGFDSYLLPLGEEFNNNMSPRCREFEKFNLAFNLASLKMCGQRQFWWETAPNFSFVHDFSGDFSTYFFTFW